jgi:hypothetical protein
MREIAPMLTPYFVLLICVAVVAAASAPRHDPWPPDATFPEFDDEP